MRRLIITENMTVDGSVEMLEPEPGESPWFDPQAQDDELTAEMNRQGAEADAMLLGRQTFEDFRGYWRQQHDDTTGVTDYLNSVAKYVVSSTMDDPRWQNSTILRGDPVENTRSLKLQTGRDILLTGSITLAHTLIAAGLVDEFRFFIYPYVQGGGRRLFPDGTILSGFRPATPPRTFPSGVTFVSWNAAAA